MIKTQTKLSLLNQMDQDDFVVVCGGLFEHSPWVAARTWYWRPFASLAELHERLCWTMKTAPLEQQLSLITAHPDLVGRLAREGRLTHESTREQAAAGLSNLSASEIEQFERHNSAYRHQFGFPFIICARENKKEAILAAFPVRLKNDRSAEISTALGEIGKIARLRLVDAVTET